MSFPFIVRRQERTVQILIYHRVNDGKALFFPGVRPGAFEKQMEYLATRCRILTLAEAVERMKRNDVPENAVVVTFDDGYRDNYLHAFPILAKYGVPATIFLATGSIGTGVPLWHDLVFSAFEETKATRLENFDNTGNPLPLLTLQERFESLKSVLTFLRSRQNEERRFWIEKLRAALGVAGNQMPANTMLEWNDIREMSGRGVSFGSHTVTHPVLTTVPRELVLSEIVESKREIEEQVGVPVDSFAYPNGKPGDFNREIKSVLKDAGFSCAVTTIFGSNRRTTDLYELRRGTPWDDDLPSFAVKFAWYKYCSLG